MTQLRIRPPLDGAGTVQPAQVRIALVRAEDGTPTLGFVGANLYTPELRGEIPAEGLVVALAPQTKVKLPLQASLEAGTDSTPSSVPTRHRIELRAARKVQVYLIEVPDKAGIVELSDVLGVTDTELEAFVLRDGVWNDLFHWRDVAAWNDGASGESSVFSTGSWDDDPFWNDDASWAD